MAFDDILSAITQETDQRIADAKDAHAKHLSSLREESERRLLRKKTEIEGQLTQKKSAMRAKAEAHVALQRRNAALRKKQELLTRCYDDVKKELAGIKPAAAEKLLAQFLGTIKDKGEIRPSGHHKEIVRKIAGDRFTIGKTVDSVGGFLFVSDTQERDFTFESLVDNHLRPLTEVQVSAALFS